MGKLQKQITFSVFIIIAVVMLVCVSIQYWVPLNPGDYIRLLIYLIFLIIVNSFPVKIGNTYITFILAISIMVFLRYGIVAEVWLVQIALMVSLLISDSKRTIRRIMFTQAMFIWVSLSSAFVFFLMGGVLEFNISELKDQLIPISFYAVTYFFINNFIVFTYEKVTLVKNAKFFSEELFWDALSLIFTLPFGVLMYVGKQTFGNFPMLIIAIQFFLFTFAFRFYNQLHQSHQQIQSLHQLITTYTSELDFDKTIAALQQALREVLIFNYSNIYIVKGDSMNIISSLNYNGEEMLKTLEENKCSFDKKIMGKVMLFKKPLLINNDIEMHFSEYDERCVKDCKSFLSVPMIWRDNVIGILNFASLEENNFSKNDVKMVNILASQGGLALKNASKFQITEEKSLLDELTGLYNYRAFSNFLSDIIEDKNKSDRVISLVMIDIDYFKSVNDTYGHQAGNDVLKGLASLLKELTRKEDIVSRFGGEEFTIIIPDADSVLAIEIAERIRLTIEKTIFKTEKAIDGEKDSDIEITVSIGISTYPAPAASANDLVKFADMALYVGSKTKGRNKISVYEEGETDYTM